MEAGDPALREPLGTSRGGTFPGNQPRLGESISGRNLEHLRKGSLHSLGGLAAVTGQACMAPEKAGYTLPYPTWEEGEQPPLLPGDCAGKKHSLETNSTAWGGVWEASPSCVT